MPYDDTTLMPFGKHKGVKLANVPDHYLVYLYDEGLTPGPLRDYIIKNLDALRKNAGQVKRLRKY